MRVHESTRGCFPQVFSYYSKFKSTFVGKPKYILYYLPKTSILVFLVLRLIWEEPIKIVS